MSSSKDVVLSETSEGEAGYAKVEPAKVDGMARKQLHRVEAALKRQAQQVEESNWALAKIEEAVETSSTKLTSTEFRAMYGDLEVAESIRQVLTAITEYKQNCSTPDWFQ